MYSLEFEIFDSYLFVCITWDCFISLIGSAGGGISRDEFIDNVAKDILDKLPKPFEIFRIKKALQANITPTGVVLLQELERYNVLVETIQRSLEMLRKVNMFDD